MARVARVNRQPPHRSGCSRQAGFTLLEIMVALLVLTLIVTSAFGALRLGQRSWEAGLRRADANEELRMVSDFLRRQFNQILTLGWSIDGEKRIAFRGDSSQVQFIAPAPHRRGGGGLLEYSLAAEPHDSGTRLVLSYRLFDPGASGLSQGQSVQRLTLAERLQSVSLRYYGSPDSERPPAWHQHWNDDAIGFPRLVHVQVTGDSAAESWPDLYLALRQGQTQ